MGITIITAIQTVEAIIRTAADRAVAAEAEQEQEEAAAEAEQAEIVLHQEAADRQGVKAAPIHREAARLIRLQWRRASRRKQAA